MAVHPTAVIDDGAKIDSSVKIGPFTVIGENVEIGKGCQIGPHAYLKHCRVGDGSSIGSFTAIGGDPQMLPWDEVASLVVIGNECVINEHVSVHRSKHENGATKIGDRCMLMANTHVGHDCRLANDVVFTTYSGTSGHVDIEEFAILGGGCGIHQFARIGAYAMIGGMARITQDVVPFMLAEGSPARIRSTNAIGLKRKGFSIKARRNIKEACKALFHSGNSKQGGMEALRKIDDDKGEIKRVLKFMESSKRGLTGI